MFDYWITDRLTFQVVPPKSGDTGDFERWITDREYFDTFVEATSGLKVDASLSIAVVTAAQLDYAVVTSAASVFHTRD